MQRPATWALAVAATGFLAAGCGVGGTAAVRPSPPCRPGQLAVTYLGGQPATGNDFGSLLIMDRSGRPCSLPGSLRVAGLNRAGRRVTTAVRVRFAGSTVLSPRAWPATAPAEGWIRKPGELVAVVGLQAEYRDGPARIDNGLCTPLWVTPATWQIRLRAGQAIAARNADLASQFKLVPSGGLVTCRGKLGATGQATVGSPAFGGRRATGSRSG